MHFNGGHTNGAHSRDRLAFAHPLRRYAAPPFFRRKFRNGKGNLYLGFYDPGLNGLKS
jgi:hypothetical protein